MTNPSTSNTPCAEKTVIITGAGTGIGKACALKFLEQGYRVGLAGRRLDALNEAIAQAAPANRARALAISTDVSNPDSVKQLFETCWAAWGRLDTIFNNAGTGAPPIPLEELSFEQWKAVVDINLTGSFLCTQQAFRFMQKNSPKGGRIINNGSISAYAPRPNSAPYTATKHAVTGLTKSSSLDGRKHNIAVSQIDIGNALTDMAYKMTQGVPQANGQIAVEAVMDVQHVANSVFHIAQMPLEANVQFMTVMATTMPYIGRG
jgi:NAD(P)-dependent dehydrogenase (short-subunit alcohol dehydrogenase family)